MKKLLLHACCAPCSSSVLERLTSDYEVTVFFYNPNITDKEEYEKRLNELKRFLSVAYNNKIQLICGEFCPKEFFEKVKNLTQEPEGGKRCYVCYKMRLEKTAQVALEQGFDIFTTTLSVSPYKNANYINEIGENLQKTYNVEFLTSNFKKQNGYKRSIELSKIYNLYRQPYCGCVYSLNNKNTVFNVNKSKQN